MFFITNKFGHMVYCTRQQDTGLILCGLIDLSGTHFFYASWTSQFLEKQIFYYFQWLYIWWKIHLFYYFIFDEKYISFIILLVQIVVSNNIISEI